MFFTSAPLWKLFKENISDIVAGMPEVFRIIFEFLWKARWFIVASIAMLVTYNIVMALLPYIIWTFILKNIFGGLFSLFL
jgi:hypothetical protein